MSNDMLMCNVQRTDDADTAGRRKGRASITRRGRKQLEVETTNWQRISDVIGRVLRLEQEG
jgi:hypothetical protein